METLLIVVASVYAAGMLLVVVWGVLDWSMERTLQRDSAHSSWRTGKPWQREIWARQNEEHEQKARAGARRIFRSPLWPLIGLAAIGRIVNDAKLRQEN